tara:strand:- start:62 stop:298 length:237 start_codon:yes stop_codon:yes gene_type:complete
MQAKVKKNQAALNRAIKWLTKHNEHDTERNRIDSELGEDCKQWRAINRKCETSFDKYLEACDELPKYEVERIEKSELY